MAKQMAKNLGPSHMIITTCSMSRLHSYTHLILEHTFLRGCDVSTH